MLVVQEGIQEARRWCRDAIFNLIMALADRDSRAPEITDHRPQITETG